MKNQYINSQHGQTKHLFNLNKIALYKIYFVKIAVKLTRS